MKNVYVYNKYGIYDSQEFSEIRIFSSEEKGKEYFKKELEREKEILNNHFGEITKDNYDFNKVGDGNIYISEDKENMFICYEYGYCTDYSLNMFLEKTEVE